MMTRADWDSVSDSMCKVRGLANGTGRLRLNMVGVL